MGKLILFNSNHSGQKGVYLEGEKDMYEELVKNLSKNRSREFSISEAERLADDVLKRGKYLNISGPIPIVKIAKTFGFAVFKEKKRDDNASGNIFIGGTTKKIYDHDKVIVVGDDEEYYHQRFIIAHELAHYLMDYIGSDISKEPTRLFSEAYIRNNHNSAKEVRADRFAAELLMPEEVFLTRYCRAMENSHFNRLYTITYLSEFFETKKSCIERRIQEVIQ